MGKVSFPFYGAYAMTKYALEAMVDAQRLELSQTSNIRVCLMELGHILIILFAVLCVCIFFDDSLKHSDPHV